MATTANSYSCGMNCWSRGVVAEANEVGRSQVNSRIVCHAKEPGLGFEDDSHEGTFVREALSPVTITPDQKSQTHSWSGSPPDS